MCTKKGYQRMRARDPAATIPPSQGGCPRFESERAHYIVSPATVQVFNNVDRTARLPFFSGFQKFAKIHFFELARPG